MPNQSTVPVPFLSASTTVALSTTPTAIAFTNTTATDPNAIAVPDLCFLAWLALQIDTIAGGATGFATFYLSADAAGQIPLTDDIGASSLVALVTDDADPTVGGASARIDLPYRRPSNGTVGTIYLQAALDVGTANATGRLWGQQLYPTGT